MFALRYFHKSSRLTVSYHRKSMNNPLDTLSLGIIFPIIWNLMHKSIKINIKINCVLFIHSQSDNDCMT